MGVRESLRGFGETIGGFFRVILKILTLGRFGESPEDKEKKSEKIVEKQVYYINQVRETEEKFENDQEKIGNSTTRRIVRTVGNLFVRSNKLFTINEGAIKLHIKLFFQIIFRHLYELYLENKAAADIASFNQKYEDIVNELMSIDKDKLQSFFKDFNDRKNEIIKLIGSVKDEKKEKYEGKLKDAVEYTASSLIEQLKVLIEFKKYFYDKQVKNLKFLKKNSKVIESSKDLKDALKLVIGYKEDAKKSLKKQEEYIKKLDGDLTLENFDELFNNFIDELKAEKSAVGHSLGVLGIFMRKKEFIRHLPRSYKELGPGRREWFLKDYLPYLTTLLLNMTRRKQEVIKELGKAVKEEEKKTEKQTGISNLKNSKEKIKEIKESAERTKEQEKNAENIGTSTTQGSNLLGQQLQGTRPKSSG
ncbi:hypothetical protein GF352_04880 [archaeon]|nr:hypothetical protein [archaeon]